MEKIIYLDNAATTRPYPKVIKTMDNILINYWENPSGNNSKSDEARMLIENVRQQFADDLNCNPEEIIFTSSGSESNSLAVEGFLKSNLNYDLYISYLEHASLNKLVDSLSSDNKRFQFIDNLHWIPNNHKGIINPDVLNELLSQGKNKPFVIITAANSEIGTIEDIKALAAVVHKYDGVMLCDAVQLFPERQINVYDWDIDMLSISAQKFGAGRGCGVLYVKKGVKISPIIYGSQEQGLRGGTYNTAAICGAGKALEITRTKCDILKVKELRNKLLKELLKIPGTYLNGALVGKDRLANNISLTIDGVSAEKLLTLCDLCGIVIAKGSACQSHNPVPSQALISIGMTEEEALNTIRITLGYENTMEEIEQAAKIITQLIERIRLDEGY